MLRVWGRGEVHASFRWGGLRERDHLKDLDVDGRLILKLILNKQNERKTWTRLIWFRIGARGGLL
jgi:hypothetical protein